MKRTLAGLVLALAMVGCGGSAPMRSPTFHGGYFTWESAKAVKVGMTEAEVIALMGKPYQVITMGPNAQRWTYMYTLANAQNGWAQYPFRDGRVTAIPHLPFTD